MAKLEAKVSIEKIIHNSFTEVAKELLEKHGIRVDSIEFSWIDMITIGKKDFIIDHTVIKSRSFGNGR